MAERALVRSYHITTTTITTTTPTTTTTITTDRFLAYTCIHITPACGSQ